MVLNSWGPRKFDAELFLDGKAVNPSKVTDNVTTGTNRAGRDLDPTGFWIGWRQPACLDRLGLGAALERVRGEPRIAWDRQILGPAAQ